MQVFQAAAIYFMHKDHLGCIEVLSNEQGATGALFGGIAGGIAATNASKEVKYNFWTGKATTTAQERSLSGEYLDFNIKRGYGMSYGDPPKVITLNEIEIITSGNPDAVVYSLDLDFFFVAGGSIKPVMLIHMLNGPQSGQTRFASNAGGGGGSDISVSLSYGEYYYSGDIDNFSFDTFSGKNWELEIGFSLGPDYSVSLTASGQDQFGGHIFGANVNMGVGASPTIGSVNFNLGATKLW